MVSLGILLLAGAHEGRDLGEVVTGWDGAFYRTIATEGYVAGLHRRVFFPALPVLTKPLLALGAGFATAGLVVVLASGLIATVLIVLLVRQFADDRTALLTAALWSAQPAGYVLSVTYSEALFTALAAGCLLALVKRRWLIAGLCAAAASAARPSGIALALACGVPALIALRREPRAVLAAVLAPLGALVFFGYLWWALGTTPTDWLSVERSGWDVRFDGGLFNLYCTQHVLASPNVCAGFGHPQVPPVWAPALLYLAIAGVILLPLHRAPLPLMVYTAALVAVAFMTRGVFPSLPRLLLPAFATLIPFAARLSRRPAAAVAVWTLSLLVMTAIGVAEFVYFKPGDPAP